MNQTVRIFLASPSADTQESRATVVDVILELQGDSEFAHLRIDLLRWDDEMRAVMCEADHNPQIDICTQLGHPRDCELVIGLFAHTMGGVLPDREPFGLHPTGRCWHCTEWELAQALDGKRAGKVISVWRFRDQCRQPDPGAHLTADEEDAYRKQSTDVRRYLEGDLGRGEPMTQGYRGFADQADLHRQLRIGLRHWMRRHFPSAMPAKQATGNVDLGSVAGPVNAWLRDPLTPDQQALLDALVAEPDDPPAPDAQRLQLAERVLMVPVLGLRGYLLKRYAQWCSTEGGRLDRRFVSLTLLVNHGKEADVDQQYAMQGDRGRFDRLQDLLAEKDDIQGWVLVGEPGSGKSTLLQHHELHTARTALRMLAASSGQAVERPEVCIWQRLSHYDAGEALRTGQSAADWLRDQWQLQWQQPGQQEAGVGLPALDELQRHVKLRWVLDGLNEMRYASEGEFEAGVQAWRQWAVAWSAQKALPQPAPLFSVRTKEQADLGTTVRRIDIEAWSTDQVRLYCRRRFLAQADDESQPDPPLWQALSTAGHEQELAMCQLPFNLAAQCTLYQRLGRLARHRAELISGLVWLGLVHDLDKPHLRAPGLLSRFDRQRVQTVRERGWASDDEVMLLPVEGRLLPWLDRQAEQMHRQGRTEGLAVSEPEGAVIQRLPAEPRPPEPRHWLDALQQLGWWRPDGIDRKTGRPLLRFTHQLWQEFFAARSLCDLLDERPGELPDLSPPPLPDLDQTVQALGAQMPLLGPRINPWEEAVRLLLQFGHQDPVAWLAAIRPANLPMAGRVAVACRAELQASPAGAELLDSLRADLLARSRDPVVDLRLRIEAGLALGELGDPRYEERVGPHGRFLWPLQWIKVPTSSYIIGDAHSGRPDEQPETSLTLQSFYMAFAPVTNAEYRCFVDAGGYRDEGWWRGETARRWLREGVRNDIEIDNWRAEFAAIRTNCKAWIAERSGLTDSNKEDVRAWSTQSEAEHESLLEQWFGARKYEVPSEWHNPVFNAASQPVVGLSLYEAQAYAHWLQAQCGLAIRLPTEAEWDAAARGASGRRWPWGDESPEKWQTNADPAHLRRTSPVGVFVDGNGPEGFSDLAGNVLEWTASAYTDNLDSQVLATEVPDGPARRAVRGGSWRLPAESCRAAYRSWYTPADRDDSLGFRLVWSSGPIQGAEP